MQSFIKKFLAYLFFGSAIILLTSSHKKTSFVKKNNSGMSRWTGTVTMEQIIKYTSPDWTGTDKIEIVTTFVDALPTMYRDNVDVSNPDEAALKFKDDKGTGSHTFHSDVTVGGKHCVTDCQGSGEAELHAVVINEEEHSYDIEAIGPGCKGTTCGDEGGTAEYQSTDADITITEPLGSNMDVLTGSTTTTADLLGTQGTMTNTTTWHLERSKPNDVELIVTPQDYDSWLPVPGRDELSKGSMMTVNLKLQGKNRKPLNVKAESFELRLNNTSKEPGITINYPLSPGANQLPDLRFLPLPNIESVDEGQSISLSSPDGVSGKAYIGSYDGGGWTMLTAVAILNDGHHTHIQGRLLVPNGETEIRIPKRDPNSNIATAWLSQNGKPGDKDDIEASQGNTNNGDGLTAYEEYRGVICESDISNNSHQIFKRLDPQKKELGVRMKKNEFSLFSQGISLFLSATGVIPIPFDESEISADRRLNNNSSYASDYKQYVEILEKEALPKDAVGENQPYNLTPKIPKNSLRVVIDIDKIKQQYQVQITVLNNANRRNGTHYSMPYTEAENIANTVAHELTHGMDVKHHGNPTLEPDHHIQQGSSYVHVFAEDGSDITEQFRGQTISSIGIPQNDESGDLNCIMAYAGLYNWAYRVDINGSENYYKVPILPLGKTLCSSEAGSGINAGGKYFGDAQAKHGNCISQIRLKD